MPNPKTDPATLRAWSPMTQAAAGIRPRLCPTHGDATAGVDREPGSGARKAKCHFWGRAGLGDAAPIDIMEAAGAVMGPFHPPKDGSRQRRGQLRFLGCHSNCP